MALRQESIGKKRGVWSFRWQQLYLLAGCALGALAYPLFLVPNHIAPGGVTGIATVLHFAFGWPVGISSLLMNIPLFIIGYRSMGHGFVLRTLIATVIFSLMIDLFRFPAVTDDPLLAAAFGALLLGVGLGLILRAQATTGGTDMLARMVHQRFTPISVGVFLFALDCAVVLLAGITMSPDLAMYSMICVLFVSRIIDKVLAGLGTDKACYIISRNGGSIPRRLLEELSRGVTVIQGRGAYSGEDVQMYLCVVGRLETMNVKKIVKEEDRQAFVFITDTHETLGEGFEALEGPAY